MKTAHLVASTLASLIYLLRHTPAERELQTVTLDHLARLVGPDTDLVVEAGPESLAVNDTIVPIDAPGAMALNEQMLLHGVLRTAIAAPCATEQLLSLATALAASPGTYRSFEAVQEAAGAAPGSGLTLSPAPLDLSIERFDSVQQLLPDVSQLAAEEREEHVLLAEEGGLVYYSELQELADLANMDPERLAVSAATSISGDHDEFTAKLSALLDTARHASERNHWDDLLEAALALLEMERAAPSEAVAKGIRLELRRMLPRKQLYEIARLASTGGRKDDAIAILRTLGADSTEALMDLLVDAMTMGERRGYFSALTHMSEGHEIIIAHLNHHQWYVVRNAAELCGEMDLERAVPALVKQIGHSDERVRRSVAGALAKIGTPEAAEGLRKLMQDAAPAVRMRAVSALNSKRIRGMVMPISSLLSKEDNADVIREATLALGRIGAPEAVQALATFAEPGHRILGLGGRPTEHRVWAVEGLALAGGGAAAALQALQDDKDKAVSGAAKAALAKAKST